MAAIDSLKQAVKVEPGMEDAWVNLGQFLSQAGPDLQAEALHR